MNILAIGAHPDDIELGCFGALALHQLKGDNIFGILITNGERGGIPEKRKKESENAAKLINMKLSFGGFPDGKFSSDIDLVEYIDKIINKYKIDIIYTQTENDRHQDHRNLALATKSSSRFVKEVYSYETPSSIGSFIPQVFIDISKTFKIKEKAIGTHKTQIKKYYMEIESVKGLARYRAFQSGQKNTFCEAFEVNRIIKNI